MILIVAPPEDDHAAPVAARLRERGEDVAVLDVAAFPRAPMSWTPERARIGEVDPGDVTAVWLRRLGVPEVSADLHPGDAAFARSETFDLLLGVASAVPPAARWVNPVAECFLLDAGRGKIRQLAAARAAGLEVPRTLATNRPDEARAFVAACPGGAVYKPFRAPVLDGRCLYTTALDAASAPFDALAQAPGIFQERVAKRVEIRATVFGSRVYAAEIDSQGDEASRVDWRRRYKALPIRAHRLPRRIEDALVAIHRSLGLAFGTADMIVTPDDRYVFLETNQQGQWLWTEPAFGAGVLVDAMCDLLTSEASSTREPALRPAVRLR